MDTVPARHNKDRRVNRIGLEKSDRLHVDHTMGRSARWSGCVSRFTRHPRARPRAGGSLATRLAVKPPTAPEMTVLDTVPTIKSRGARHAERSRKTGSTGRTRLAYQRGRTPRTDRPPAAA